MEVKKIEKVGTEIAELELVGKQAGGAPRIFAILTILVPTLSFFFSTTTLNRPQLHAADVK